MQSALAQSFLSVQREAWDAPASATLDQDLQDAIAKAKRAWPGVEVDGAEFADHLAGCCPDETEFSEALALLPIDDLYLAFACAKGEALAIGHFERFMIPAAERAIARIDAAAAFVDEILHQVRLRLLVEGELGPAKIRSYTGRGPLSSWVQVVAMRAAYSQKRKKRALEESDDVLAELPFDGTDPETASLRARYAKPFKRAFEASLAELQPRERTILRLYLIDGVPSEAIGRMYRVHRATVARWISKIHSELLAATRKRLRDELEINVSQLDSVMRLAKSRVEVSIATILTA